MKNYNANSKKKVNNVTKNWDKKFAKTNVTQNE